MKIVIYIGVYCAAMIQSCFGQNVSVVLANTPKSADTLVIAADGLGLRSPIIETANPVVDGNTVVEFMLPKIKKVRFRAIALTHQGARIFPLILAVVGTETDGTVSTVPLDFAALPLSIALASPNDSGDGTISVPVLFSGGGAFFSVGEIVNMWVSPQKSGLVADGTLFRASLLGGAGPAQSKAIFKIPRLLAVSTGQFQVGYYGLDFRTGPEIPLLVTSIVGQEPVPSNPPQTPSLNWSPGTYRATVGRDSRLVFGR